jgi:transcriptional regulator with XRE-family HTH domain
MELEKAFGETVRIARKAAALKQEALAEILGVQTSAVSRIERGAVSPSLRTVQRIALALDTHPSELLRQAEQLQAFTAQQAQARAQAAQTRSRKPAR